MKIAVIGPLGPTGVGGVTRHSEELNARLAARGHEVVLFGRSTHTPEATTYRGVDVRRVRVVPVRGWETFLYGWAATGRVLRGFDVVHYQGVAAAAAAVWPPRLGTPTVLSVHSVDHRHPKWGPLTRRLLRRIERRAVGSASAVIAVSQSLTDDLRTRFPSADVRHIPNGLRLPPAGPPEVVTAMGLTPGGYALFVGRLVPEKGVHVLVDAAAHRTDIPVAIVGDPRYAGGYASGLRDRATTNVVFLGARREEELGALYANARLLVTPSIQEGFGLTALEASGFGVPTVASDLPAFREVLGAAGTYVEAGDADALADAVAQLWSDERTRAEAGRLARARATEGSYDWDEIASRTEAVLASVQR